MNIKNKLYETNYDIVIPSLKSDSSVRILNLADLHYQKSIKKSLFIQIIEYARETNPNIIVMPGDLIETIDFINDAYEKSFFEWFMITLSDIAPVIIVPGNHEVRDSSREKFKNRYIDSKDNKNEIAMSYFYELDKKVDNIHFLDNSSITIEGINFFGFNLPMESYVILNNREVGQKIIEEYHKCKFKMKKGKCNVLVAHSPSYLLNSDVFNSIPEFSDCVDLVITAHLHDGYMPKIFDKTLGKTNVGLFFTPYIPFYRGTVCRGVHEFGRGYLIILQGYRKWTADHPVMNTLEKVSVNDIENIILNPGKEKSYKTTTRKPYKSK